MKTLEEIFDKNNCDKGSKRHNYDRVYEPVFKQCLNRKKINILEIGVLYGESTKSHLEYLPNATIYTIDLFCRVSIEDIPILNHDRVKWCKCNSIEGPNADFKQMVKNNKFDIIIDDGAHDHIAQYHTFKNFHPYLKKSGKYFIEDVWAFDQMTKEQKQRKWLSTRQHKYSDELYNNLLGLIAPHHVTFHDLRDGYQPNTYIIEVGSKNADQCSREC